MPEKDPVTENVTLLVVVGTKAYVSIFIRTPADELREYEESMIMRFPVPVAPRE
jgi:hypothetical protein